MIPKPHSFGKEVIAAWQMLEGFGYPPEANDGCSLADAIENALHCLIRQHEDLLKEVVELRTKCATARLIAAAPALIKALVDLCRVADEDPTYLPESEAYLRARAAIAEAVGDTTAITGDEQAR